MKFVAISDTHGQHHKLILPQGDVLIHAGDVSKRGLETEIIDFLDWFKALDYKYKIFIAGNHDFFFERASKEKVAQTIPENIIYLNDSGVSIEGINIWGSPISPWFYNWAFNRHRGGDIKKHWNLIPSNTDIVVTHGPVAGKLDKTTGGLDVGCEDLLKVLLQIKPKIHICGHIHEAYGQITTSATQFINASVLDEHYFMCNAPVEFNL